MKTSFSLLGSRGFVGSTLLGQTEIKQAFHRENLQEINLSSHDHFVFCAAPAEKWKANLDPERDLANLQSLVETVKATRVRKLILISTVDVFNDPVQVDELSIADASRPNFYGANRLYLENELRSLFPNNLVVRLPGLVGTGLKKNAIYDLKMGTNITMLNPRSIFQFYPMKNLFNDIEVALKAGCETIHLTAEPVSLGTIAQEVFGTSLQPIEQEPATYDFRTINSRLWGRQDPYQYSALESLEAIREYASR